MAIQEGNIVFLKSQVMDDVPEGGGAATGLVVPDGVLNNVFEDISDLDRVYGRLNLRKLFIAVRSLDTDLYGGAKLAVTALPSDPALGYTMFTTGDQFDTRVEAADRVESYLYKGPMWPGALYDNHIEGMRQIRVIQRVRTTLPTIGKTLCLVQEESEPGEQEQYVRVIKVDAVETTFSDDTGDFQRLIVTLDLSDALRFDFLGHTPNRYDSYSYTDRTRLRDTTVADATNYFGSQPLAESASIGALQVRASSIFTQLVPSAQSETPLVSQTMAGQIVDTVDAGGGLSVEVAQTAHTRALPVTAENRRLNWIETLSPIPRPGSLSLAYMSQGNWYELFDDGAGIISGSDPTLGSGPVNYVDGVTAVTLGALPDAGSQIMYTWTSPVHYAQRLGALDAKRTIEHSVGEPIKPGTLTLTWLVGGVAKTASADISGEIAGDAGGYVSHVVGDIRLELTTPPDSGTRIGLDYERVTQTEVTLTGVSASGGLASIDLGEAIEPGSLEVEWDTTSTTKNTYETRRYHWESAGAYKWRYTYYRSDTDTEQSATRYHHTGADDGAGGIIDASGSVTYASGAVVLPVLPAIIESSYTDESGSYQWHESESTSHTFDSGIIVVRYTPAGAVSQAVSTEIDLPPFTVRILPRLIDESIVPGSVRFSAGSKSYEDRGTGVVYTDVDPNTGSGIEAGTLDYATGVATLTLVAGSGEAAVSSCLTRYGAWVGVDACFRTQLSPLKPEALSITLTTEDGVQLSAITDADGNFVGDYVSGSVDYQFGTAALKFGSMADDPENPGAQLWIPRRVDPSTLRYNAVAYSYLPLDADILGIDAVRLPADGRVPIYRPGNIVMILHAEETGPQTVANGAAISCGRTRLAFARVIDANGETISGTLYELDRATGTVTIPDVSGLAQPLTVRHTVGDLRMVTDAQISGWLSLSRELTHDYPADESVVAGCLIFGDRRARVSAVWDQVSWTSVWQDSIIGSAATATLNLIDYPITVTNEGCDTDRWLFRCTNASTNAWELISEQRGLVWSGIFAPGGADVAPINARTRTWDTETGQWIGGTPYMTIPGYANGGGWATGNCIRINTVGAIADFWIARSIQQSEEPLDDGYDSVEIYALGNVDRP